MASGGVQLERLYSTVGVDLSELHTGLNTAKTATRAATTDMAGSFEAAGERIEDSNRRATASMGNMGSGARMLGIQLGQASQQLMGGANAAMVFAQQGPDIAFAMSGATGAVGRFAAFMTGPFGAAIFTAVSVLGMMGLAALDASDDMDTAAESAKELARAIAEIGDLDFSHENLTAVSREIVDLRQQAREASARYDPRQPGAGRLYQTQAADLNAKADTLERKLRESISTSNSTRPVREMQNRWAEEDAARNRPARADRSGARAAEAEARRLAREAEQEARAQAQADAAFRDALEQSNTELLRAKAALAVGVDAEASYQNQLIDAGERAAIREIEDTERWSREHKDQLIALEQMTRNYERLAVAEKLAADHAAHAAEVRELQLQGQMDAAEMELDTARTTGERRAIMLRLVELDYQLERIKLDEVLASTTATEAEKEIARIRLSQLEAMRAGQVEAVQRGTMDILSAEGFGQKLGETLEGGILEALKGKSLKEAMKRGLTEFLHDAIDESFNNLMSVIFGKGGSGGLLGGLFSSLLGGGARAVGGPVLAGHAYDVGLGEKFIPSSTGRVLSRADAMDAAGGGGGARVIRVEVDKSDFFDVKVREIADSSTSDGIGHYDGVVGARVGENYKRRGG